MFKSFEISDPRFEAEGLRTVTVKSPSLKGRGDISVWAPDGIPPSALVILLHGVYGSHWSWSKQGGAHRTAARMLAAHTAVPMALAMPSDGLRGDGSGYIRHEDGIDFERWIVEDVPLAIHQALPQLPESAPIFIAGLSMGGFGALRLGSKYSSKFSGISAHSSVTHLSQLNQFMEETIGGSESDPTDACSLSAICQAGSNLPPLRFDCGTSDPLLNHNRVLHDALTRKGVDHTYVEFAGGHEWSYWEKHLEDTLRFFSGLV